MKKIWKVIIVVAGVLSVLLLAVLLISPDKKRLDQEVRDESGSAFVELSEGFVEYDIAGPESGAPVVLVHGLSVPMYDWDRQMEPLADAGYRVIRYNQYGRGLSDRPRGPYDPERYVRQLKNLMDAMGWESATLVGHSMGCSVAAEFAIRHPDAVDGMVFIAPVLHLANENAGIALARVPIIGDIAAKTILAGIIGGRAEQLFVRAGIPQAEQYTASFREQMSYRGFSRSVKSLFRNAMVDDMSATYLQLDGNNILTIRGADDESVTPEHFSTIVNLMPDMGTVVLTGVGHMPNMESADVVNRLILDFLNR